VQPYLFTSGGAAITEVARLGQLDGLRAIAASAVVAFHFDGVLTGRAINERFFHLGAMGVDLFFVLSGFVIFMTIERQKSLGGFAARRAGRIFPVYWASVILEILLAFATGAAVSGIVVGANFTMLQRFMGLPDLNPVYWTLAFEIWFYILIAFAWRLGLLERIELIGALWLFGMAALRIGEAAEVTVLERALSNWFVILFSFKYFGHLFIAGMMIYRLHKGEGGTFTWAVLFGCFAFCLLGREDWLKLPYLPYVLVCWLSMASVYFAAAGRLRILGVGWLAAIGAASYSLYLLHVPLVRGLEALIGPSWAVGVASLLALPISFASYRWIERPAQHLFRSSSSDARRYPQVATLP
jgi:peptidoglycan/LPS O-acetylase OafA/YrhL